MNITNETLNKIFSELKWDEKSILKRDKFSEDYKKGFTEAVRTIGVIIKQETNLDVVRHHRANN